jgi:diguanylate cyclase (GGDEF)-like protein
MDTLPNDDLHALLLAAAQQEAAGCGAEAVTLAERARDQAERRGAPGLAAQAGLLLARGLAHERLDEAMKHLYRALAAAQAAGDLATEAQLRAFHSGILCDLGQFEQALADGRHALELAERSASEPARARAYEYLGAAYSQLGQHEQGIAYLKQAVDIARGTGDAPLLAHCSGFLGLGYLEHGAQAKQQGEPATALYRQAIRWLDERVRVERSMGSVIAASTLANLAFCHGEIGEYDAAEACLEEGFAVARAHGNQHFPLWLTHNRGELRLAQGRPQEARALLEAVVAAAGPRASLVLKSLRPLAKCCEQTGDLAAALVYFRRYHDVYARQKSDEAQRLSRAIAVQMETEQAKNQAEIERLRAQALERANRSLSQKAEQLSRASFEDPLTGLANRRRLDAVLEGMRHERRARRSFAIALIDIDHFKRVNDTYSHLVGDEVLRRLGRLLGDCRHEDLAARYGGEEFALLLHDVDRATAHALCDRLRARIQDHPWHEIHPKLRVTASIGIANAADSEDLAVVLAAADRRLYAAKHGGRNAVVSEDS